MEKNDERYDEEIINVEENKSKEKNVCDTMVYTVISEQYNGIKQKGDKNNKNYKNEKEKTSVSEEQIKKIKIKRRIYFGLMCMFMASFVYSATSLLFIYMDYKKGKDTYEDMANLVIVEDTKETEKPKNTINSTEEANKESNSVSPVKAFDIDFDELKKINSDVIGWIYCPNTVIDYPIVQTDNNEYYLKHLINKSSNKCGTIFMDCNNNLEDDNYILYGHHMKNGSMFASIDKYKKQDYYDEHPYVYLILPDKKYKVEIFAGYTTENESATYVMYFHTRERFADYLKEIKDKSDFKSKVKVTNKDKIVTLSTCAYDFKDARYVIQGKLVEVKEVWR